MGADCLADLTRLGLGREPARRYEMIRAEQVWLAVEAVDMRQGILITAPAARRQTAGAGRLLLTPKRQKTTQIRRL